LATVPEPDAELAEEFNPFNDSGASLAAQPSAQPQPQAISIPYKEVLFGGPPQVRDDRCHAFVPAAAVKYWK
jgi:hypothetical protein